MSEQVERVEAPSRQEFREKYLKKNKPVIVTGVANRWRAFSEWTPEYLKSVAGDAMVTVHFEEKGSFFDWYLYDSKKIDRKMKLSELIDILLNDENGRQYYMTEHKIRLISKELLKDVDFTDYFDPEPEPYEAMLFLGRDTCMPLHYHGVMEAFLCQLYGEKTVTLFSPQQYRLLHPRSWYQPRPLFSQIDGRKIYAGEADLERFPRFKEAKPIEFTLKPGEMLFIPVHWWHLTKVAGYQVSVTHFWRANLSSWNFPTPGLQVIASEVLQKVQKGKARIFNH